MEILVVVPVYNEETEITKCITKIHSFLSNNIAEKWRIVVADNASTDSTLLRINALSKKFKEVDYIHLKQKGRGRALKRAWSEHTADVNIYMDVDLATDISAIPDLVSAIKGGADLAVGCRLAKESVVLRSLKREFFSRGYNWMLRRFFDVTFTDAQCGFKAVSREVVERLLPQVADNKWFFDTELLVRAELAGYRIRCLPVKWREGAGSKVSVLKDAKEMGWSILSFWWNLKKEGTFRSCPK